MRRRLEFSSGDSRKFWEAEQKGAKLVLRWGRLGTRGQTKTKEFGSLAEAKAQLQKAAASKLKKGYLEVGAEKKKTPADRPPAGKGALVEMADQEGRAASVSSFTKAQDRLYSRGWPHIRELSPDKKSKRSAAEQAAAVLSGCDPRHITWSPRIATAFLRGPGTGPGRLPKQALAAMSNPAPLCRDEAAELLARWCASKRYGFIFEHVVLLTEALLGTDGAIEIVTDWLEGLPPSQWKGHELSAFFGNALTTGAMAAFQLGFLLLRSERSDHRERLQAIHESGPQGTLLHQILDLVLHGGEAARRLGVHHLVGCHHVDDDAELVRAVSATDYLYASLSPRFVWLGGPEVLEHFVARAKKGLPVWGQRAFLDQLGTIRHPYTIDLMLVLAASKRTHKAALKWFGEHADFVTEHADRLVAWRDEETVQAVREALEQAPKSPPDHVDLTHQALDAALDELLDDMAKGWQKARSDARRLEALEDGARRYTALRNDAGLDPDERAGHFFVLDGAGNKGALPDRLDLDEAGVEHLNELLGRVLS